MPRAQRLVPAFLFSASLLGALAMTGCPKHDADPTQDSASTTKIAERDPDDWANRPSPPAPRDRVPALVGPGQGMLPGFLDGSFLYASARLGALQELGQSLPLSPELARGLGELGGLIGADPRDSDLLARFELDPQARISMSVRPLVDHAGRIRETLDGGGPVVEELTSARAVAPAPEAMTGPPSDALAELYALTETLGFHVRVHVPFPARQSVPVRLLEAMRGELPREAWATTCASLRTTLLCGGGSDEIVVIRQIEGALQIDAMVFFHGRSPDIDNALRRALVERAVAMPPSRAIPRVGALRGDMSLAITSAAWLTLARASGLAEAIRAAPDDGPERLTGYRERDEALRGLHDADRIFDGVSLEAEVDARSLLLRGAWLPSASGQPRLADLFTLAEVDADVPTLDQLCAGALVCARSRGLPSRDRFSPLAKGAYADLVSLEQAIERVGDDAAMGIVLLTSWPNLIGSVATWPSGVLEPPESMMAEQAVGIAERTLGFGFALTDIDMSARASARGFGFARMRADDLATLQGLVSLTGSSASPIELSGVPGSAEAMALPDDFPARFYALRDPPASTGEWGWAILSDTAEGVGRLAAMPRDDGSTPLIYVEVPKLWPLVSKLPELVEELGYAQHWLDGRSLRAQIDLADGAPELRVLVRMADVKP